MSEVNTRAAVGAFADDGTENAVEAPATAAEAIVKMDEIVAKYDWGEVLSEEDQAIVKACLPVVGATSVELSADDAFVGEGDFAFERSELGCEISAKGNLGCKGVGEARIEMWGDMRVQKTGGDTCISNLTFKLEGVGFGMGPTGNMKLLYKRDFSRSFANADSAIMSFHDRYTFTQWGFYFKASCAVATDKGTFVVE